MARRPSGQSRLLDYLKAHVGEWVHNQTLRSVSGIDDVPRTIRFLRQAGWDIEVRGDGYNSLRSAERGEARGRRAAISQKTRYLVLQKSQFRRRACGRGAEDGVKLVIDHIVPVDWGGSNEIDNLQALCEDCNHGKQAWVADLPAESMRSVLQQPTVERRSEALFDQSPNQDVPSLLIQLVSGNALDWQRALRRIRERTGKRIEPVQNRRAYRYFK
jgi:hypothetical protein